MVKLIARLHCQPGQADDVAAALLELVGPSRAEAGCMMYDACRSKSDPNEVLVLEEWASQEALDEHMTTPHFRAFGARLGGALAGEPELIMLERLEA
jgi:quinol monooxygenase YgiN